MTSEEMLELPRLKDAPTDLAKMAAFEAAKVLAKYWHNQIYENGESVAIVLTDTREVRKILTDWALELFGHVVNDPTVSQEQKE